MATAIIVTTGGNVGRFTVYTSAEMLWLTQGPFRRASCINPSSPGWGGWGANNESGSLPDLSRVRVMLGTVSPLLFREGQLLEWWGMWGANS